MGNLLADRPEEDIERYNILLYVLGAWAPATVAGA
jgi:hypothetical protein